MNGEELRFVVVGKTGCGKSSSINTIVGHRACKATASSKSATHTCQLVEENICGKHLVIIDTPGLYDTALSMDETKKEIARIIGLSSPGFHAFLVVLTTNRFTEEEINTISILAELFGQELYDRTVLLFTGLDNLERDGTNFDDYLNDKLPEKLESLITKCGRRVVGFNNRDTGTRQVEELIRKISIVAIRGSYYTNEHFKAAARILEEEKRRRLREDPKKQPESVRQEIRRDMAEGTSLGTRILKTIMEIAYQGLELLVEGEDKLCVLS